LKKFVVSNLLIIEHTCRYVKQFDFISNFAILFIFCYFYLHKLVTILVQKLQFLIVQAGDVFENLQVTIGFNLENRVGFRFYVLKQRLSKHRVNANWLFNF
jgi:hypothetical protein